MFAKAALSSEMKVQELSQEPSDLQIRFSALPRGLVCKQLCFDVLENISLMLAHVPASQLYRLFRPQSSLPHAGCQNSCTSLGSGTCTEVFCLWEVLLRSCC